MTSPPNRYVLKPPALGEHQFRRPGFLRFLTPRRYAEFFEELCEKDPALFRKSDTPEGITKSITSVGYPLSQLFRHILVWFKPEFEVPIGAQYSRLKAYDVQIELLAVAFPVGEFDPEAAMIAEDKTLQEVKADYQAKKSNAHIKMLNLERRLIDKIVEHSDIFDVSANTKVSARSHSPLWTITRLTPIGCLGVSRAGDGER